MFFEARGGVKELEELRS